MKTITAETQRTQRGTRLDRPRLHLYFLLCVLCASAVNSQIRGETKYENNFEKAEVGSVPEELLVLDGGFVVKEEAGNKFLELPGAPLESYSVMFGPAAKENIAVSARILGSAKGRRYPTFGVGVNGGGYKLRVSPGKKQLELYRSDDVKATVPLQWESGKWASLKLSVVKSGEGKWQVQGKLWQDGNEPAQPTIAYEETEEPRAGRQLITASPYSGTPIRFDNIKVASVP